MNKTSKKINKILDEAFCCEVHEAPFEKAITRIKSLLKEYAMEIINTKIKSFGFDKASQEMGADMLRAEQREKVEKLE